MINIGRSWRRKNK